MNYIVYFCHNKIEEAIADRGGDFDRIIKGLHPALSLDQDQKLKRNPLGFDYVNRAIEYNREEEL